MVIAVIAILALGGGVIWYLDWRVAQAEANTAPKPGARPVRKKPAETEPRTEPTGGEATPRTPKPPPTAPTAPRVAPAPAKSPAAAATPDRPKALADLKTGKVVFEKAAGTGLIYAVGTLTNASAHERYDVHVEVSLTDDAGQATGVAKDMRPLLGPGEAWRFRALILDSRAKKGSVSRITEGQ